jgi:hypothetical protein
MNEIRSHDGSFYARGVSTEGFAGGYLQALDDIEGALTHGSPSDNRGYWRKAERELELRTPPDTQGRTSTEKPETSN